MMTTQVGSPTAPVLEPPDLEEGAGDTYEALQSWVTTLERGRSLEDPFIIRIRADGVREVDANHSWVAQIHACARKINSLCAKLESQPTTAQNVEQLQKAYELRGRVTFLEGKLDQKLKEASHCCTRCSDWCDTGWEAFDRKWGGLCCIAMIAGFVLAIVFIPKA